MTEDLYLTIKIAFYPAPPDPAECPICNPGRVEGAERALAESTAYLESVRWPNARSVTMEEIL